MFENITCVISNLKIIFKNNENKSEIKKYERMK